MDGTHVAGEVVTAGTALAGFILIYIASLVTGYGGYQPQEQKRVIIGFLSRAWIAFVGMVMALLATALSIIGKWEGNVCAANVAVWLLIAAFAWAVLTTVLIIREIK
jgi:hypothetical protein